MTARTLKITFNVLRFGFVLAVLLIFTVGREATTQFIKAHVVPFVMPRSVVTPK